MANITINQLVNNIRCIADRHLQINDFGFGPTHEIGESRDMNYPYLWVSLQPNSTILTNEQFKLSAVEYEFSFIVADRISNVISNELGQENDNGLEVISDTQLILFDILSEINNHPFYSNNRIQIKEDVNFSPSFDERDDLVNAWVADVTITMPFTHTYCANPIEELSATASINRNC
jgi:hypothetical protein